MPNLECLDDLARNRVKYRNGSGLFGSDPDLLAVRGYFDAFRLCPQGKRLNHRTRGNVDDADGGDVFVGYVKLRAIAADVEVLRVGAAMNDADNFVLCNIEDPDSIGALVGRRKCALIDVWSSNGRATQRDVDRLMVRAGMDAPGPLAQRDGGQHVVVAGVDHGEISADFVGYVNSRLRGFCRRGLRG